jgi:YggT family protein
MFVFANLLQGVAAALGMALQIYFYVLLGRAIISWVNADPRNAIVRFLVMATEPPLRMIRRLLPQSLRYFPLDIAFLVLLGLVIFAQYAVVQTLYDIASRMRRPEFPSSTVGRRTLPAGRSSNDASDRGRGSSPPRSATTEGATCL